MLGNQARLNDTPEAPLTRRQSALEITVSYSENTLDVRHLVGQKSFVIGEGKAADFSVSSDDLPASEFPLVRSIDGHFVITFIGDQRGEIEREGVFRPLQWLKNSQDVRPDEQFAGCYRYVLPLNERATLRFGALNISVRYVSPPDRVEEAHGQRELRYSALLLGLSTLLVVALGGGLLMSFRPETAETKNFWVDNPRVARLLGQADNVEATRLYSLVLDTAPIVTGLDAHEVATRMAAEAEALGRCVTQLQNGSGIRATMIIAQGRVTTVQTEALNHEQGEEGLGCLRETLQRVVFPAADGRVVYTLGVAR